MLVRPKHLLVPLSTKEVLFSAGNSYRGNECSTKTNKEESDPQGVGDEMN